MEAAFIRYIEKIWTAAQPTRSTACKQADKYGYPNWALMTSTPNGSQGTGKFFYDYWNNAVDSDLLFEINKNQTPENETNQNLVYENFVKNADDLVNDKRLNSFIRVRYKWDEDPRKSVEWYEQQKQELNFNTRQIGQELDLEFVGSSDNPFDDIVLSQLQKSIKKPISYLDLSFSGKLKIFSEIDLEDYYIIGVDTASAINGCYSAIEVYSFKNFKQVAELALRVGSLHEFGVMVNEATQYFVNNANGRVILIIENNSIGKSVVEQIQLTDLIYYLYYEKDKVNNNHEITEYGLSTNGRTKPLMTAELFNWINKYPENFVSEDLINQLHSIERNNAGQISSSSYTDMFMASCFCAYCRKMKELEILPQLSFDSKDLEARETNIMKSLIEMSNPKKLAKILTKKEELSYIKNEEEQENIIKPVSEDENDSKIPFFFSL